LPIETENARVGVRVFLKHAHGRRNAKSGEELETLLKAARIAQHLPAAETMALLHHFQKKDGGRRITLDVYRLLIRKLPTQSLYWIEL